MESLEQVFNIPPEALSFVNGELVGPSFRLRPNDVLEFIKQFGEKEGSSFFRYPGGKFKLRNEIIRLIKPQLNDSIEYREPFFGGGSIGLQLLEECPELLSSVWFNDRDFGIAALWSSVIRYPDDIKQLVMSFAPALEEFYSFKKQLAQVNHCPLQRKRLVNLGFQKLALHQMSFSGLGEMAGGPLGGKLQLSDGKIDSRWSPEFICNKIDRIHQALSHKAVRGDSCSCLDFEEMIDGDDSILYLDPPYYDQGTALYKHAFMVEDHERLARLLRHRKGFWLLSYDDCDEIRALYDWAVVEVVPVTYSITGTRIKGELLICPRSGLRT